MLPESTVLVPLVLSINPLHSGKNHLLSPVRHSEKKNMFKHKDLVSANGIISSVTSSMLQQSHAPHIVEVLTDVSKILLAIVEWPFDSSRIS